MVGQRVVTGCDTSSTENSLSTVLMQENHNDQPIELTYPVEIQFTESNETNDSNQPMEQDSDREPTAESSNTRQVIKKTMEDLLKLKRILETAIQSLKYSLPALHLPRKQTDELIQALIMAAEQFKNVQDSARPFAKYLKKEDRYVIEALITRSEERRVGKECSS